MKKQIFAVILSVVMLIGILPSMPKSGAKGKTVYVSESESIKGLDPGITVYPDIVSAIDELGESGGTVYISGLCSLPSNQVGDEGYGPVVIKAYDGKTAGAFIKLQNTIFNSDVKFDDVSFQSVGNETYISLNYGATVEFGENCVGLDGITNLRAFKGSEGGGTLIWSNKEGGVIWYASSFLNQFQGEASIDSVGDIRFVMNNGKSKWIHCSGKADVGKLVTIKGDTSVTVNGGTVYGDTDRPGLQTGASGVNYSVSNFGNTVVTINGGLFTNGIGLGAFDKANKNQGNVAIIVNGKEYATSGNTFAVRQLEQQPQNENRYDILIFNNSESFCPTYKAAEFTEAEYIFEVKNGKMVPVFKDSEGENFGELLGFRFLPDDTNVNTVLLDGNKITGTDGIYKIDPKSAAARTITFARNDNEPDVSWDTLEPPVDTETDDTSADDTAQTTPDNTDDSSDESTSTPGQTSGHTDGTDSKPAQNKDKNALPFIIGGVILAAAIAVAVIVVLRKKK